jgi:ribose transport system permease protein
MTPTTTSPEAGTASAGASTPSGAGRKGRSVSVRSVLARIGAQNIILFSAILLLAGLLTALNPNFLLGSNLITIGTAVTISGLLAVVQTVVMIMGGIDLTVGSVAGLASVISAMVFTATNSALGILTAIIVGALCGLVNAVIIVIGRVPPMIATLAGLTAFKGVAQLVSDGRAQGYTGADPIFRALARGSLLGIPTLIWVLIVAAVVLHVLLQFTKVGRNIYAVGGNDRAARLSGIDINRYIVGVFVMSGVVAALAGILITARTGSGQPVSGSEGLEFQSITAAALGGVALRGGKGTIGGTILAVVLLGVLLNGMTLLGVNPFWQNLAQGLLLVIAVIVQQSRSGERRVGLPK